MPGLAEEQAWQGEDYGWIKQQHGDLPELFARSLGQPSSLGLFRLLRDVTTSEEAQLLALKSGSLLRALDQVFGGLEEAVGVSSAALQFVSNCVAGRFESGAEARELVWREFDFPKAVRANASAASLILYLLCVVDDHHGAERRRELTDKRRAAWDVLLDVCEEEQCAYWVLVAVADSCCETSAVLGSAKRLAEVLDEEEKDFPVAFALYALEATATATATAADKQDEENPLLVKLAAWSADHPVGELALAKRVLDFCFARITAPQLATTQCLQLIANVLTRGNDGLKDYARERGAIKSILLLTRTINPKFPTQREWALFAFRACCERSPANQQYVYELQTQSVVV